MTISKHASVLITGAGRGIGKRLAIGFAKAGARVGLLGRSRGELEVTKLEIEAAGGVALNIRADIREFELIDAAIDKMIDTFGSLDVLIANAGVQGPIGPFAEIRPRNWKDVFETNILGTMNCFRAVLPRMIERRQGKIIAIAGGGASTPRPNFACYAGSKAAIVRFAESVAEEVREHNVQINCLAPGGAYTSMTDEILDAGDRAGSKELDDADQIRLTGGVSPEKQIQLALFLASNRSNHVTGKLIHANDDWKKLEFDNMKPESFTLRRQK